MKSLLFFVLLISFACNKSTPDLGSEYQYLVGKWELVNQDAEKVRITFKSNGKVYFEHGANRGAKYKVTEIVELFKPTNPTSETIHTFLLKTNDRELVVEKKEGYADTIYTYAGTILIDSVGIDAGFNFHRIKN